MVQNAALLIACVLVFDTIHAQFGHRQSVLVKVLSGILVGAIGVCVMLTPWTLTPGVVFDTRSVLLSIAGLFFGTLPTLVAMLITAVFRVYQGGSGALTGVLVILATGTLGIAWRKLRKRPQDQASWLELYGFGLAVHGVMLALMFTFPWETALRVLANISLPVLVIYPLANALLGKWLVNRLLRDRLAEENKKEKSRFKIVADNTADWEYWLDPQHRFEYCSPSCEKLTGYTQAEFNEHPDLLREMIYPEDVWLYDQVGLDSEIEPSAQIEFRIIQKDGDLRWVGLVYQVLLNEDGVRIGIRGSVRDIHGRKLAEKKVVDSQKRLAEIIEFLPDATMAIDRKKRVIIWNRAMEEMTGIPASDMLGKGDYAYTVPFYGEAHPQLLDLVWASESEALQRYPDIARDGKTLTVVAFSKALNQNKGAWVYAKASPLMNQEGDIIGAIQSVRDISRSKQAEETLRSTIDYLNRSQSIGQIGNWSLDLGSQTFSASLEGCRLFGYPPGAAPAFEEVATLIQDEDQDRVAEALSELIQHGTSFQEEIHIRKKDTGELRYLFAIGEIERDAQGRPSRVFGISQDITDRRKSEEQIRAAQLELQKLLGESERSRLALLSLVEDQKEGEQKIRQFTNELEQRVRERTALLTAAYQELESFSYSVSHDLRAPLRALNGFSSALLEDYEGQLDERGRHYIARIQHASLRMGQLINDLLDLSRVSRSNFSRQSVDFSALAATIAAEIKTQAPEREINFEIAQNILVNGDLNLLKIALENLLNNACKFTSHCEIAHIQVGVLEKNHKPIYFVRDNGAGFDMQYASKLFSPFQRLHGEQEFPGTGIGLTIVQRIISRHGGRIWPEAAVNQGAAFYFTLGENEE